MRIDEQAEKLLNKIKNKEELNIEDYNSLVYEYDVYTDRDYTFSDYYRPVVTVSKLNNTYIIIYWTELVNDLNEYNEYPVIVEEITTEKVDRYRHTLYLNNKPSLSITTSTSKLELE